MKAQTLLDEIITPTLKYLGQFNPVMDSMAARQFLLAIAAQESRCGRYFLQINGVAQGIWQVEPDTLHDLYANYLRYRKPLMHHINALRAPTLEARQLVACPLYCCAVARILLFRFPEKMPEFGDRDAMWAFYKQRYNTPLGKATQDEWDRHWKAYVEPTNFWK